MNRDLSEILSEWAYRPGELSVRLIEGTDGEPRIQVRIDLGLLQMRTEGRPDGLLPHGFDSLLEYHEARVDGYEFDGEGDEDEDAQPEGEAERTSQATEAEAAEPFEDAGPVGEPATVLLDSDECRRLREEAMQYYHRYIALLVLEDFDAVVRDTTRNLRVLDLLGGHAEHESDRASLEPSRPSILMMRARALASRALKDQETKPAILAIDQGLDALKQYFMASGNAAAFEGSKEAETLRQMRETLVPRLPVSQRAELRQRLDEAIKSENYELAAILRDELRMLPE